MDISYYKNKLTENGYVIIPNVYNNNEITEYINEFNKWREKVPDLDDLHDKIDFHGIFKHHQVGHQRFSWLARTNDKILNIFKQLWNTNELVCSFDGCCYYPKDYIGEPRYWTHTDQSSKKIGLNCYQSFLSLTDNHERTLVIYKGSHLLHQDYFTTMQIDGPTDWNIIDQNYLQTIYEDRHILDVKKGDLVIWDSRTFHQNTCGSPSCKEERLVQYLCYLPKNATGNTSEEQKNREYCFENKLTTNHWPYPMSMVPEQANTYNYYNPDNKIYIDYEKLPNPELSDLLEKIKTII